MNNLKYTYIVSLLLCFGCSEEAIVDKNAETETYVFQNSDKQLPLKDFVSWVVNEENGLTKKKEISEVYYKLSYLPAQQMAYMELKNENYTEEQFSKALSNYQGMSYFNLKIELEEGQGELLKHDLNSSAEYSERVNYLAFQMQKDICVVQGTDTLYPGLYHFERIFDVAPYATVLLAFDDEKFKKDQEFSIVYNDGLFKKGFIKYNYPSNQLIDLPKLAGI